jgi:hypothetical protein
LLQTFPTDAPLVVALKTCDGPTPERARHLFLRDTQVLRQFLHSHEVLFCHRLDLWRFSTFGVHAASPESRSAAFVFRNLKRGGEEYNEKEDTEPDGGKRPGPAKEICRCDGDETAQSLVLNALPQEHFIDTWFGSV